MLGRRFGSLSLTLVLGGALALACGGPNDGFVKIVDENDDGGAGGTGGTSGAGAEAGAPQGGDAAGGEGAVPELPEPPVVVSVTPSGDELAEPLGSIEIEFSEGIDPDTITPESIQISDGGDPIAGSLDYSGVTAVFTPEQRLDLLGTYTLTVTTDITDSGGTAMEDPYETTLHVRDGVWDEEAVAENETGVLGPQLVSPVIDARGNALVVWSQAKGDDVVDPFSVWGRFYHPDTGWDDAFEIDQTEGTCESLSVAMNADGDALVAWQQSDVGVSQVFARRFLDGAWEADAVRVDAGMASNFSVLAAMSPTSEAHVFWKYSDGTDSYLYTNHVPADGDWLVTPDQLVLAQFVQMPAAAFDPDGNGFVYWVNQYSSSDPQVLAKRYLAGSQAWGNPETILGSDGASNQELSVVADDDGGAHALFVGYDNVALTYNVKSTDFSKAAGFAEAVSIDDLTSNPSSIPRLSTNGTRRLASWTQYASLTENIYSALGDADGYADQELRSNGDYDANYGDAVSGMDRRGNAALLFAQLNGAQTVDIMFARLAGSDWADAVKINQTEAVYQDARVAVAANGVAVAVWSIGTRQVAESILMAAFE